MMLRVLDTDTLTLLAESHPAVTERFHAAPSESLAITVFTVEEQLSGWYTEVRKAKKPGRLILAYRELAQSVRFLAAWTILDYTEAASRCYEQLRKQKIKTGRMDLRIAATVLANEAILVTRNLRDFKRVPGLQIEDWSK